MSGLNKR